MTKTRADKRRAKRRAAHSHRGAGPALFSDLHRDHLIAAMFAEQEGDLVDALECLRRTPHRQGSGWEKQVADLLVTANPGCLLQNRASMERMGEPMPLAHPMEVVDASIRGKPLDSIL